MHYLLIYETSADYVERRTGYRDAHLALAWQAAERGELLLGGATGDPADGAMLLFQCDSAEVPRDFAARDPYVRNGLVRQWRVLPWHTVAGAGASDPVRPA